MDVPLIRAFGCGYVQGAKAANAKVEVVSNMTGTTPQAFNDPARGGELARSQFDRGVDVVFHAAGGTGMGVLQAAKDKSKLGIGVDSNQNHLFPGFVLTSMLKRVDNAVNDVFMAGKNGTWKPGTVTMGLKEGGVDWAVDANNRKLISKAMETRCCPSEKRHYRRQNQGGGLPRWQQLPGTIIPYLQSSESRTTRAASRYPACRALSCAATLGARPGWV